MEESDTKPFNELSYEEVKILLTNCGYKENILEMGFDGESLFQIVKGQDYDESNEAGIDFLDWLQLSRNFCTSDGTPQRIPVNDFQTLQDIPDLSMRGMYSENDVALEQASSAQLSLLLRNYNVSEKTTKDLRELSGSDFLKKLKGGKFDFISKSDLAILNSNFNNGRNYIISSHILSIGGESEGGKVLGDLSEVELKHLLMKKGFDGDVIAKFAGVNGHFLQDTIDTSTDAKDFAASCDVSALVARSVMSLGNSTFQEDDYDAPAIKPSTGGFKTIEEEVKGKFEGKFETPKGTKPSSKNKSKSKTFSDENILGNKRSSNKDAGPDSKKGFHSKENSSSTEASKESVVTVNFLMIDRENLRTKKSNSFPTKVWKDPLVFAQNKNFEHELKFNLKGTVDENTQKMAISTTFCSQLKSKTFYIFKL